jgi:hypothetical protein
MSNAFAIAAVTSTLRHLLQQHLNRYSPEDAVQVTTCPLDKAWAQTQGNQINLFLYQTQVNAAWRNLDVPGRTQPGETGRSPLPLKLYYLLTANSDGHDFPEPLSHRLLGQAMLALHDNAILDAREIQNFLPREDREIYDLHNNLAEPIRIIPYGLSLDDLSKLWTTFQTEYRVSTAYEVSVVLIESLLPSHTPLPVLERRGTGHPGIQPSLPRIPTITEVILPRQQQAIAWGQTLMLKGLHLTAGDGSTPQVRFRHPHLSQPLTVSRVTASDTQVELEIAEATSAHWIPGLYTVSVVMQPPDADAQTTNEVPVALAPQLVSAAVGAAGRTADGTVTLSISCQPAIAPQQRVSLLIGDREVAAPPRTARTHTLEFAIPHAPRGEALLRLRVDGIDSLLVDRSVSPPRFNDNQKVSLP